MGLIDSFADKLRDEFLARIVDTVATALTIVFLARSLEAGDYGLLFLAISIFSIAGLVGELGIAKSAGRYLTEYNDGDRSQVRYILRVSLQFVLVTLGFVSVFFLLGHELLADVLDEPSIVPFLLLGVGFIVLRGLSQYLRRAFQGLQRIRLGALVQGVRGGSRLLCVVTFVSLGFGALGALAGYIVSFAITVVIGFVALYYVVLPRYEKTEHPEPGLRRRIFEYSLPLTFTKSADKIVKQVDVFLIGFFLNPVAVGYYTLSKQVVTFTQLPSATLGYTLSPMYAGKKTEGSVREASRLYEETLVYTLTLYVPAAVGLILVAEPLIRHVFGAAYAGAVPLLQILAVFVVFQALTQVTSGGLDYLGRATDRATVKFVSAIGNAIMNVVLIPTFGVAGAAVATVVTYGFYTVANLLIMNSELPFRTGYLARQTASILLVSGAMAATVVVATPAIDGVLSLLSVVLLGVAVWGLLCAATGLIDVGEVKTAFA